MRQQAAAEASVTRHEIQMAWLLRRQCGPVLALAAELEVQPSMEKLSARERLGGLA